MKAHYNCNCRRYHNVLDPVGFKLQKQPQLQPKPSSPASIPSIPPSDPFPILPHEASPRTFPPNLLSMSRSCTPRWLEWHSPARTFVVHGCHFEDTTVRIYCQNGLQRALMPLYIVPTYYKENDRKENTRVRRDVQCIGLSTPISTTSTLPSK